MVSASVKVWTALASLASAVITAVAVTVPLEPTFQDANGHNLFDSEFSALVSVVELAALLIAFNVWATCLLCSTEPNIKVRLCGCYVGAVGVCLTGATAIFMLAGVVTPAPSSPTSVALSVGGSLLVVLALLGIAHSYYVQRVFSPVLANVHLSGRSVDLVCDFCVQVLLALLLYRATVVVSWIPLTISATAANYALCVLTVAIPCVFVVVLLSVSRFEYVLPTLMAVRLGTGWQYVTQLALPGSPMLPLTRITLIITLLTAGVVAGVRRRCYLHGRLCC